MKRTQITIIALWMSLLAATSGAQPSGGLSLPAALEYARQHSPDLRNARTDVEISRKKVKETTAIGLPQLNAGLSYNNYPNIPTQLLPDFLSPVIYGVLQNEGLVSEIPAGVSGQLFPAQFGTKHNFTAQLSASQLLFNGPYIVGLQAARAFVDFARVQESRTLSEVEEAVSNAYYQALVAGRSVSLLDSTRSTLENILRETRAIYAQGFIEETDVDQLELLLSDLDASLSNARNQQVLALRLLKFRMGMPIDQEVALSEDLEGLTASLDREMLLGRGFDPEGHVGFAMARNQETLNRLDLKRYQSLYLPSLSAFYSYQRSAQRQEFDFTDPDKEWYPTEVVGLQLDIPLWSSGSRKYQVQQARLNLEKSEVIKEQVKEGLKLEASNARSNLENAWMIYRNKEKGMATARKIYDRMRIRYKEGMASSLELQQTHNQWLQAEGDHILSLLQLFTAKTAFDKATREL